MTIAPLNTEQALRQALAFAPDKWWRPRLVSVAGVTFNATFTKQQAWMETSRLERQYLSTDRTMALPRAEPIAPPEYSNGIVQWLDSLGPLVDCPTCAGNGRTTCKTCKGQQKIVCPRCGPVADHRPPCTVCNGLRVVGQNPCSKCEGRGYESPCLKCDGKRSIECNTCIGAGLTTCEKCEGNSRVYQVDVRIKTYETTTSITWHQRPALPTEIVTLLEQWLPMVREEPLEKPEGSLVEVLGTRRLHHVGRVEVIRFVRLMNTTIVSCGGYLHKISRGAAKALPDEWFNR